MAWHVRGVFFVGLIFLIGCAVKNPRLEAKRGILTGTLMEDMSYHPKLVPEEYVIEESDQLEVSVQGSSELTRVVTVRSDGVINYDLVGRIPVVGLTVSQAEKLIQEKLLEYVKDAKVSLQVVSSPSKYIYVFGKVGSPGTQPYTGRDTVLDVIARAGVAPGASIQNIYVVRQDPVNPRVMQMNLKDLVTKGLSTENIRLKPKDIVYVSPNVFSRAAEVTTNIMAPITPITSPVFTLQSLDTTLGLNLAGKKETTSTSSTNAAATLAAANAAATTATATSTTATSTTSTASGT